MFLNEITIVITTFFSEKKLIKCLKSINGKCKVIVIENSKNNELKKKLNENYKNIECIVLKENSGFAKSNNIGIKMVKTKYALILNPDTILAKDALHNFLTCASQIKDFSLLGPYFQTGKEKKFEKNYYPISVNSIKGFAMFLNLKKFNNIGFFDENFFLYFEDIDLCKRVILSGNKIYLLPNVIINHEGAKSVNFKDDEELEVNRNWHWMWSSFYYSKKYKGFFKSLIFFSPKLFMSLFKFIFFKILRKNNKSKIYQHRFLGLLNSIKGNKSFYRPKIN